MDALEAIETCRAMRYLRPDPVPDELLRQVLHAATRASSPGNSQGWSFVVVRDPEQRRRIAKPIREQVKPLLPEPAQTDATARGRMLRGAHHLLDHLEQVPVWIFVCGHRVYPPGAPSDEWIPAAVFPAAQNLIVAARALGLGTVFTTYHRACESEIRELLGLPDDATIGVTIPLGFPARKFGPLARRPLDEVVHFERWSG